MEAVDDHQNSRLNRIPDGNHDDDDESQATEMADADEVEWDQIIENLWYEYDRDGSGFLEREEMIPVAQAALAQIGYSQAIDDNLITAFF